MPVSLSCAEVDALRVPLLLADCTLKYDDNMVPADLPDPPPPSFPLTYVKTEPQSPGSPLSTARFAGHQTWKQREDSFFLNRGIGERGKRIHCGFVHPPASGEPQQEFFRIAERDRQYLSQCRIAVVSALFGNFDKVHRPQRSRVRRLARSDHLPVAKIMAASWAPAATPI